MLISVRTPTHDITWLKDAYDSLKAQTYTNREWCVFFNNRKDDEQYKKDIQKLYDMAKEDPRVKIFIDTCPEDAYNKKYIGRLKHEICMLCKGDRLVELDHDDLLTPDCLEEISKVPEEYGMCYSNTVNVDWPSMKPRSFREDN